MTKLFVQEYAGLAATDKSNVEVLAEPPVVSYVLDYSGGHAESAAFNAATKFIEIENDSICSVVVGAAPVAALTDKRLPANTIKRMGVVGGQKISAITNT